MLHAQLNDHVHTTYDCVWYVHIQHTGLSVPLQYAKAVHLKQLLRINHSNFPLQVQLRRWKLQLSKSIPPLLQVGSIKLVHDVKQLISQIMEHDLWVVQEGIIAVGVEPSRR